MGTPDFASASLEALLKNRFDVTAVFTQPDKPRGRGMEVSFCDVKKVALAHDLPVYQPTTLRTEEATELIRELNPDILVVVAYGKLIPDDILAQIRCSQCSRFSIAEIPRCCTDPVGCSKR